MSLRLLPSLLLFAACSPTFVSDRALHLVDGQQVHSTPPTNAAYAAYLRARLALEAAPPRLADAKQAIDTAIALDPDDAQLWTVRAEIAARMGDGTTATKAVARALQLRPDYPPAKQLSARLGRGEGVARTGE
ncbi:MAG: hypothetical protein K1X88_19695 [Nannocystaceae bacterium]|nr:hypothetical protein [Nannocystaceae bacterium]